MRRVSLLGLLLGCAACCYARFVIEEGGIKVVLPPEAKEKYKQGFDVALANFGEPPRRVAHRRRVRRALAPPARSPHMPPLLLPPLRSGAPRYGGALRGRLIYVSKDYGQDYTCSPPCIYGCQDFQVGPLAGMVATRSSRRTVRQQEQQGHPCGCAPVHNHQSCHHTQKHTVDLSVHSPAPLHPIAVRHPQARPAGRRPGDLHHAGRPGAHLAGHYRLQVCRKGAAAAAACGKGGARVRVLQGRQTHS